MTPLDWVLLVGTCIGFIGAATSIYLTYRDELNGKWSTRVRVTAPTLPAGPELDRRIAEEFMGLIPFDQWEGPYPQQGALMWNHTGPTDHHCYRAGDPPPYSRSWGQAREVLEELERRRRVASSHWMDIVAHRNIPS